MRTDDIQRAAALATLVAYGSHIHLRPLSMIKNSECDARLIRMQVEYLKLMRELWPEKDNRCDMTQSVCDVTWRDGADNYCPVHGRDIR